MKRSRFLSPNHNYNGGHGDHLAGAVSPETAEAARKAAGGFAFYSALSLLIGAFIASVAGALGGFHRDEM